MAPLFPEFVAFCRALGTQHVDLQVLSRTFSNSHPNRDAFFEKHFWHTAEEKREARARLSELMALYADDPFVVKKPADLPWMLAYVDDPDFRTEQPICGSHHRNLFVDAQGNAALCYNTAAIPIADRMSATLPNNASSIMGVRRPSSDRITH